MLNKRDITRNPLDALAYLHLQMGLEGKGLLGKFTIKQVKVVPGEEMPLILLARLADGRLIAYYAESLSPSLQAQLSTATSSIQFPEINPILDILNSHNLHVDKGHYKTCLFPAGIGTDPEVACLTRHEAKIKSFGFDGFAEQVYAIERDGRIASACVSVRENQSCGEAWVYTDPGYRRKGLAKKVVRAWAHSLIRAGKVPFYSHKIENAPSAKLAEALQLQPIFEEIAITELPG